mmetsp:Transcript_8760/g.15795  ORF Transcript_8760/g.15795 Transcript_8760/m.15795 type:complete len:363 (-) Transcript_8760:136-1224(-)|eukprot:CAMPEP_0182447984 /NCGR_PEP_ID=MMETSP1172-20130603/22384_1 /TAXON_ID=708627 /ORGANISM="Timspurckia oligopyrenoides, Strain CCMP3278" /LENGTH=362 /DNA_ID=CAMNT_0024644659 /DNA_START=268 /DNA_END=1356 /DNA_ORIENTATION=+
MDSEEEIHQRSKAAHHDSTGRFINPWPSFNKEFAKLSVALSLKTPREPVKDVEIAALALLSARPDFGLVREAWMETRRNVGVTWIGHCSYVIQMYGATILTDPNFSMKTVAPFLFGSAKRLTPVTCPIELLPSLDMVVITSTTEDKLDEDSVRGLIAHFGDLKFLVPLNVAPYLTRWGVRRENIKEMDWYNEITVGGVRVSCCPAQHLSGEVARDHSSGSALWCSWMFVGIRSRVFYVGSTGYRDSLRKSRSSRDPGAATAQCPAFKEIGERFWPIDLALLPIGNYAPQRFVASIQCDPTDSVDIFCDLRARQAVAHNWGTFTLGDEEVLQPLRDLERAMHLRGVSDSEFSVVMPGKTTLFY